MSESVSSSAETQMEILIWTFQEVFKEGLYTVINRIKTEIIII